MQTMLIELAHATRAGFEAVGILAIIIGAVWSALRALIDRFRTGSWDVRCFRSRLGRSILLGLEFLVAGDIINTVALEPSLENVAILGAVVVIRTFLSWSLEVEIEGKWPWQSKPTPPRNEASG